MNSRFDENESEFGVFVLSELFEMLSDGDGFFNQVVEIFWNLRGQTIFLQDSEDFATSHSFDLRNTNSVSEGNTDLGG